MRERERKRREEHDKNLQDILKELEKNKFKINIEKIQYKQKEIKLLGAIINGQEQRPISKILKKKVIVE